MPDMEPDTQTLTNQDILNNTYRYELKRVSNHEPYGPAAESGVRRRYLILIQKTRGRC